MCRPLSLALVVLLGAGCASDVDRGLAPSHAEAMRDSVATFLSSIPPALASDGPNAWLRYFESSPSFFMASDGAVAFPAVDSARAFLAGFSANVARLQLEWERVRVEPLAPGLAVVAASYRERIHMVTGETTSFGGYMTGAHV